MKYKFNKNAAIWTLVIVIIVFAVSVTITKLQNQENDRVIPVIGALVYGIFGILVTILSGLMTHDKVKRRQYEKYRF